MNGIHSFMLLFIGCLLARSFMHWEFNTNRHLLSHHQAKELFFKNHKNNVTFVRGRELSKMRYEELMEYSHDNVSKNEIKAYCYCVSKSYKQHLFETDTVKKVNEKQLRQLIISREQGYHEYPLDHISGILRDVKFNASIFISGLRAKDDDCPGINMDGEYKYRHYRDNVASYTWLVKRVNDGEFNDGSVWLSIAETERTRVISVRAYVWSDQTGLNYIPGDSDGEIDTTKGTFYIKDQS